MAFNLGDALKAVSYSDSGREQIEYIRLEKLEEDPNNFYQLSDIDQLAANIELCGLQQPIRVRSIEGTDRYMIVSGHRRRKAIELLAKENPEKWSEVSCIVERDEASPALQQLRLIYANANTRKMTPAEVSAQAEQVEKLLYQLKEEGYEFPGRMRDHVAEAVGASKSKLARLKVIRENLDKCWEKSFKKNDIAEDAAYVLAQMPKAWQKMIFEALKEKCGSGRIWVYANTLKEYKKNLEQIDKMKCKGGGPCVNAELKKFALVRSDNVWNTPCTSCCLNCSSLTTCKYACPKLADTIKKMKAQKREANLEARAKKAEEDLPYVERLTSIWKRFGECRKESGVSVEAIYKAFSRYYTKRDDERVAEFEGLKKINRQTETPFGYSCNLSDITGLIAVADMFGVSLDYLLGRSDVRDMATEAVPESDREEKEPEYIMGAWYPVTVEPPVGVPLVLIDSDGYVDDGKYTGSGVFKQYGDCPVIMWTLMPSEKDAAVSAPASAGWKSGVPEAYGTYAAYVKVSGAANPMLRELLWTGDEWLMFGQKISEDVTVQCWADRPEL